MLIVVYDERRVNVMNEFRTLRCVLFLNFTGFMYQHDVIPTHLHIFYEMTQSLKKTFFIFPKIHQSPL